MSTAIVVVVGSSLAILGTWCLTLLQRLVEAYDERTLLLRAQVLATGQPIEDEDPAGWPS